LVIGSSLDCGLDSGLHCLTEADIEGLKLPASAARRILDSRSFWICFTSVRKVKIESRPEGDLLGVGVSIVQGGDEDADVKRPPGDASISEGVYHTSILLRKSKTETDWEKSQMYYLSSGTIFSFDELFKLPWKKIWMWPKTVSKGDHPPKRIGHDSIGAR
jgi:hypothetical protein